MDIIAELYEYFQPTEPPNTAEHQQLRKELIRLSDQVVDALGLEFWNRLAEVRSELDGNWGLDQFRAGFHLGASLMLEILKSA